MHFACTGWRELGYGDELMATGMARGAKARGKRIGFGDGRTIVWGPWSEPMFRGNPNIARPGEERAGDIEWVAHYKGHRLYNKLNEARTHWVWNTEFRPTPGELFFAVAEQRWAESLGQGFVLIEPNVPAFKSVAANKTWPASRYDAVASQLRAAGYEVRQFIYPGVAHRIPGAVPVVAKDFRHALAALSRAALYIGPEGGLHHGSAAVGIPGVVLFGGFIPPQVTGYDTHVNLTGDAEACGSLIACQHCKDAMLSIHVDEVVEAACGQLQKSKAA